MWSSYFFCLKKSGFIFKELTIFARKLGWNYYVFYDQFIEYWLSNKEVTNRIVNLGILSWLILFSIAFSVIPASFLLTMRKERYLVAFRVLRILLFPVLMFFYGGDGLRASLNVFFVIGLLYTFLVWICFFTSEAS